MSCALRNRELSTFGHGDFGSPREVAEFLNERFPLEPPTDTYFTLLYGVIDRERETLDWVRAGHSLPIVQGEKCLETLDKGELPIGFFRDQRFTEYSTFFFERRKADPLFPRCHGGKKTKDELFGSDRLHALVHQHGRLSLNALVKEVEAALSSHRRSSHFEDDLSFLVDQVK